MSRNKYYAKLYKHQYMPVTKIRMWYLTMFRKPVTKIQILYLTMFGKPVTKIET
jgi:hypothetical protein